MAKWMANLWRERNAGITSQYLAPEIFEISYYCIISQAYDKSTYIRVCYHGTRYAAAGSRRRVCAEGHSGVF